MVWWVWLLFLAANLVDIAVQGRDHASAVAAAILVLVTGFAYVAAQRPRVIVDDAGVTIRNPLRDYRIGWAGVAKADLADLLRVHTAWDSPQDGKRHTKIVSAWAVHYSRRRKLVAENRARRATQPRSFRAMSRGPLGSPPPPDPSSAAEIEAEKILRLISERATAAQVESLWAAGTVPISGARPVKPAKPVKGAATAADTATQTRPKTKPQAEISDPAASPGLAGSGWLEPLRSTWNTTALAVLIIPALIVLIVALL